MLNLHVLPVSCSLVAFLFFLRNNHFSFSGGDQWEKSVEKRNQSLYLHKLDQSLQKSRGTRLVSAAGAYNT